MSHTCVMSCHDLYLHIQYIYYIILYVENKTVNSVLTGVTSHLLRQDIFLHADTVQKQTDEGGNVLTPNPDLR